MVLPTEVKVLLALEPRAVMAVMHTTIIRASMTAYSTAVGPSSRFRKFTTFCANLRMVLVLSRVSPRRPGLFVQVKARRKREPGLESSFAARPPDLRGGAADGGADAGERLVGVAAQRGDRGDAHHD